MNEQETAALVAALDDLAKYRDEPLHPDLLAYVEETGVLGPMLRHPLVYDLMVGAMPGLTNKHYLAKREMLRKAVEAENWHDVVFTHERPYRLKALIEYVTGTDEWDGPLPLNPGTDADTLALVADVWVDSENIAQVNDDWRALLLNGETGVWLGTPAEREQFEALETYPHKVLGPCVKAWRGGVVGDWSWTTDMQVAQFFSRLSGYPVRGAMIPVSDVFGYLTRRSEAELLVKYTPARASLVYPNLHPRTTGH